MPISEQDRDANAMACDHIVRNYKIGRIILSQPGAAIDVRTMWRSGESCGNFFARSMRRGVAASRTDEYLWPDALRQMEGGKVWRQRSVVFVCIKCQSLAD